MSSYPNPCDRCAQCTCPNGCDRWRTRVKTIWKQFNGYRLRQYRMRNMKRQKFVYEHPDIILQYLKEGPCKRCRGRDICDAPCAAYWRWWDARMEWLKKRMRL